MRQFLLGTRIALIEVMHGYWAVFHPRTKKETATVVVAHVQRGADGFVSYPSTELLERDDASLLLEKVAFLIHSAAGKADALQNLESQFWSFMPSNGAPPRGRP